MRISISQVTQMTDELRVEIQSLSRIVPEIHKPDVSQFWLAETEADRDAKRRILDGLSGPEKSTQLKAWIADFVTRREEVFRKMKETLEAKKKALNKPVD
jgi:hypothetical protein